MNYKVYVIIVTYNSMKWIKKCLSSVFASSVNAIPIIVDNGSKDETISYIKNEFPNSILIQNQQNLGFGKANNIGIEYAIKNDFDYIYLLNHDAWIFENTLEQLISLHKKNPEYGIISPLQINADLNKLDENFSIYCSSTHCPDILNDYLITKKIKEIYDIDFVMAAHWLLSKDCIKLIGGFNPSFPHYGEDENYIHRLHYHKLKCGIASNIVAVHDRQNRPFPKSKIIYFNYIEYIKILSNINYTRKTIILKLVRNTVTCFTLIFKYFSLKSIFNLLKVLLILPKIKHNNKISKKANYSFLNV